MVSVSGLPGGTAASVQVVGPDGFSQDIEGSQLLPALTPGTYTVSAALVSFGTSGYAPSVATQEVTIVEGAKPVIVTVDYMLAIGRLAVSIAGLPTEANANIEVTGPGFRQTVTKNKTLTGLGPGVYTLASASVTAGAELYNPAPAIQTVSVGIGIVPASVSVAYAASTTGSFNLAINGMYVVQSTQTYGGTVPLIANRDGLLRIFAQANRPNSASPSVRVRLYQNGVLTGTETIAAPGLSVPMQVSEGDLDASWNLVIPASLMQPGLSIVADVDPAGSVGEGNEEDNAFPLSATPLALSVRTVPPLRLRFVPVRQSVNGRQGNITTGNREQFLRMIRAAHPVQEIISDVRAVYTTSAPELSAADEVAWNQVLSEVNALRQADGSDATGRYYYGVVSTVYTSGIAGLGYVPGRTAIGWDYLPVGAIVAAHEIGHNWGRNHAPCGSVAHSDPEYPYAGGIVGVYGFDFSTETVRPRTWNDLMGYCGNEWISDYTYRGIMDYRDATPLGMVTAAAVPSLLVWGEIVNGEPVLEPVFEVMAPPSAPGRPGPYTVEGRAADGSVMFSRSFVPEQVADGTRGAQHFAFTIPRPARASELVSLRLAAPRRAVTLSVAGPGARPRFRVGAASGEASVRRLDRDRVTLRWDASRHPVVMVRDAATGQVLSFARGGQADVFTERNDLELVASDRIHSERVRVSVRP